MVRPLSTCSRPNAYSRKVFTNPVISIATFFGGPLAAGFLIAHNFKVFGNTSASRKTIFIGVVFTLLLFSLLYSLPQNSINKIPSAFIPGIYTAIITILVERLQGEKIKEHLLNQGQKASGWLAAAYGIVGMIAIGLFLIVISSIEPFPGYEKEIKLDDKVVLHYSNKIDEEQLRIVNLLLEQSGFFENTQGADIFLSSNSKLLNIKLIIDPEILSDSLIASDFITFEKYLNYNMIGDKKIELSFTNELLSENFNLPGKINYQYSLADELSYLHSYQISENQTIHYNAPTLLNDIQVVATSIKKLKGYFPEDNEVDIVFLDKGDKYIIKFFVPKELWHITAVTDRLKSTVEYIRKNGINKIIDLYLIDSNDLEEIRL